MATHSNSPNNEDFAEEVSSESGDGDLQAYRNRRSRGPITSPSDRFAFPLPKLASLQRKGPDCVRSPENDASEPDSAGFAHKRIVETYFAELKDGTMVELVQDSENPRRTLLAVWKDGDLRYLDQLEADTHVLVPLQRRNEIFMRLRLPPPRRVLTNQLRLC